MVLLAEGLPVAPAPHEVLVTSVWLDVINHGSFDVPSFFHALDAEGMCVEVCFPCLVPLAVVSAGRRIFSIK